MKTLKFAEAIESAIKQAMEEDKNIIILGEDVHTLRVNLLTQFGKDRVISTPISEGGFLGMGVAAAMAGLRPIVEIMMIDFIAVAMDAILNHAAKIYFFSGGKWNVPIVIRASCGGGYGDGGQHEQSLWGWLAHIPGVSLVVPSRPINAGGLMYSALKQDHPVIYLEHKLLSHYWLDYLGLGGRKNIKIDVPAEGSEGSWPDKWTSIPLGKAEILKQGTDITLVGVGVDVHRALEAAKILQDKKINAEVIDLQSISPLDIKTIKDSVEKTKSILVIDEDYKMFGLSGEIAALLLEHGLSFKYGRVCTETTIPFNLEKELKTLPNINSIIEEALKLK